MEYGTHRGIDFQAIENKRPSRTAMCGITTSVTFAQKSYFVLNDATKIRRDGAMKTISAREAKNGFGLMIDTARAEPVLIEKRGRGVVLGVSVAEFERPSRRADNAGKEATEAKGVQRHGRVNLPDLSYRPSPTA